MAAYPPLYARSPFAARQYLTNMVEESQSIAALKSASSPATGTGCKIECVDLVEEELAEQLMIQEEARLSRVLEKANRSVVCGWQDCFATLGSLENLRKHIQKLHCQAMIPEELESESSSKSYRCRYNLCQNKTFRDSSALFEHFMQTHFNSLILKCPVSKCRHKAHNSEQLVMHVSASHDLDLQQSTIVSIPSARKQTLIPPLPEQTIEVFTDMPMVKPNPSFIAATAKRKMEELIEGAAAMLDETDETDSEDDTLKSAFARIEIPETIDGQLVRPVPRYPYSPSPLACLPPYGIQTQDDSPPFEAGGGQTVGYPIWKRWFEGAEKSGKLPVAYTCKTGGRNKRRRK